MANFAIPNPPPKSPYAKPDVPYVYQPYPRHVKSIHTLDAKGNRKTVTVHNPEEESYHTGEAAEIVLRDIEAHAEEAKPEYKPIPYPRYIRKSIITGKDVTVQNSVEEEYHTGVLMNEDGTPVGSEEPKPTPPTLETVMASGYTKEAAEKIVDEEAGKAKRGEKPYGDKEPEVPQIQTGAGVPADQIPPTEDEGWK